MPIAVKCPNVPPCERAALRLLSRNAICSSCRAREAAFGCEAVVKSDDAVFQEDRKLRFYDCCAAERRLRQLLRIAYWLN